MEPITKAHVLLIDDDEDDYIIIRNLFAHINGTPFTLDWVSTPAEAVEAIQKNEHDTYLVDYRLGADNGLELLSQFDIVQRNEPFIILTGAGDDRVERRAMNMGVADYLVKGTFDSELLSRVIRYAIQRKHMESQRIEQLIEVNRSKDEFIALASHQLRTPATAVKQYVGMVLQGYAGDITKQQRRLLSSAYDSNERQINVVNDILRVARLDLKKMALEMREVNLGRLVEMIIEDATGTIREREQNITFKKPAQTVLVVIDPEYIRMALGNIIDNASKYTPHGKNITVTIAQRPDSVIAISIHDEGVGIAKEDMGKLFKKFSRIHNPLSIEVGGSGLGLYWSNEVVQLHSGSIDVSSEPGMGTTFTIILNEKDTPQ